MTMSNYCIIFSLFPYELVFPMHCYFSQSIVIFLIVSIVSHAFLFSPLFLLFPHELLYSPFVPFVSTCIVGYIVALPLSLWKNSSMRCVKYARSMSSGTLIRAPTLDSNSEICETNDNTNVNKVQCKLKFKLFHNAPNPPTMDWFCCKDEEMSRATFGRSTVAVRSVKRTTTWM